MDFGRRNKVHVEPAMSALSDIIFMLLIFFIIASTLAVNGEQVNLPKTGTGTQTQPTATLTVTADLRYMVNGSEVAKGDVEMKMKAFMSTQADKKVVLNAQREYDRQHRVLPLPIPHARSLLLPAVSHGLAAQ